ncbi:MAG: DNA-3-methyladenine glycosylase [Nitrospirota bacterium]|nr:DNA-3-methyladenine glycosylase [Nitrospirota bacterium]
MTHKRAKILPRAYFNRSTLKVARSLIGKYVLRETEHGAVAGLIVEVEAYVGPHDLACHASRGRTQRTDVLFGPPGIAYVYLIYGMYHCLNVVTEREGFPAAVLIRAVEYREPTPALPVLPVLIDGPGRVCRSFQIDLSLNRWDLTLGEGLWLEDRGERITNAAVLTAPRIGVDYAGEWAAKPYRFRLARFTRQPRQNSKLNI